MNKTTGDWKFTMKHGTRVDVLEYINANKILVKFEDGKSSPFFARMSALRKGMYRNPYHPTIEGFGYEGEGEYCFKVDIQCAKMWRSMVARCFSKKWDNGNRKTGQPDVDPDWLNFQIFAKWYYSQNGNTLVGWELDKDILVPGNRTYSSDKCCIVPREINIAFPLSHTASNRVYFSERNKNYSVNWRNEEGERCIRVFKIETDAKDFKILKTKEHMQRLAVKYRETLDTRVYEALFNWGAFYDPKR